MPTVFSLFIVPTPHQRSGHGNNPGFTISSGMLAVSIRQRWDSGISETGRRYTASMRGCGTCTLARVPCMIISKHGTGGWRNIGRSSWTCRRWQAMSDRHTVMLNFLLLIAGGLFALGICAPLMSVQKWLVFTQTYTLGTGLLRL